MAKSGITSQAAAADLAKKKMPSGKWFRNMMNGISEKDALKVCKELTRSSMKDGRRGQSKEPRLVAIDKHKISRHDKADTEDLIRSKPKDGTGKFQVCASMQAVGGETNSILDWMPVKKGDKNADFVRKFMRVLSRYRIMVSCVLLDREFFSVDVMETIRKSQKRFLMPAVKNAGIKKVILKHHEGKVGKIYKYVMKNKDGKEAEFNLVIVPSKKHKDGDADVYSRYLVFATTLSVMQISKRIDEIPEEYASRWGIETGYRQIKQIRPRTTSRNPIYRMILVHAATFLYNVWMVGMYDEMERRLTLRRVISVLKDVVMDAAVKKPPDPPEPG